MDTVYFAKMKPNAKIPTKRDEDGCYDIYACINDYVYIHPGEVVLVPTGIVSAFSSKYRMQLRERGSTGMKGMARRAGEIDSGYRGEWFVAINNTSNQRIVIYDDVMKTPVPNEYVTLHPVSKAIAQAALEFVPEVNIQEISLEDINNYKSERGEGKLGSSGK